MAWGSGGLFVRLLPFDMWTIVFWRGVFGTLFIGSYVLWRFGGATPDAIRRMGSSGILITMCATAAIAWLWLRERPSPLTMAASVLALLGIVVMLGPASDGPRLGDLLATLATAATALMTVAIRRSSDVEMLPVAGLATALSVLIAWPLADSLMALSGRDFLVAAGFGLGPMTLGMMLYVIGSALIPATLTALIGTLEAPIGALRAWFGVGELPASTTFLGGGMVLAAVCSATRRMAGERQPDGRSRQDQEHGRADDARQAACRERVIHVAGSAVAGATGGRDPVRPVPCRVRVRAVRRR